MLADGDWVVPKRGTAPWLENPPLPQWITVITASLFGRCDRIWIVRLPAVLMGTAVVLIAAGIAAYLLGRTQGLLSGFILATCLEHVRYSWLAEDEIFLCALVTAAMALFVRIEFSGENTHERGFFKGFIGSRPWRFLAFFILLGMTNLVKGLFFGTAMVLIPAFGFLLWNGDLRRISSYAWLWGWLVFAAIASFWPLLVYQRYPDVLELWKFDLGGRLGGAYSGTNEPIWYYPVALMEILAPWTAIVPLGLWLTWRTAFTKRYSAHRFLWCWAILVPLIFSIPRGKHHHYLLHAVAPWAILCSFGLLWLRERISSLPKRLKNPLIGAAIFALPPIIVFWFLPEKISAPAWLSIAVAVCLPFVGAAVYWGLTQPRDRIAMATLFGVVGAAFCLAHFVHKGTHHYDARFLKEIRRSGPKDAPIAVDMESGGAMRGFHYLFYLDSDVIPLHNLSFLRDERIPGDMVYVITLYHFRRVLEKFGTYEVVKQSDKSGREGSMKERLTLFRLRFRDDIYRLSSADLRISPMQAMYRARGPYLEEK